MCILLPVHSISVYTLYFCDKGSVSKLYIFPLLPVTVFKRNFQHIIDLSQAKIHLLPGMEHNSLSVLVFNR
jgi:hypothetical protein